MISASTTAFHPVAANRSFATHARSAPIVRLPPTVRLPGGSSCTFAGGKISFADGLVQTTQAFQNAASQPSTSSTEKPKKVNWPEPVRKYVQRAFMPEHNVPGIGRVEMEEKLKQTITKANEENALATIDWDNLPLPQQMIQNERAAEKAKKSVGSRQLDKPWRQPQLSAATSGSGVERHGSGDGAGAVATPTKRKSTELYHSTHDDGASEAPPWRKNHHHHHGRNGLEDRKPGSLAPDFESRLSVRTNKNGEGKESSKFHNGHNSKRQRRANEDVSPGKATFDHHQHLYQKHGEDSPMRDAPEGPIVGKATALEKKYFRLTAPPNPETVRPLAVLRTALDLLKKKWKQENSYAYICDQFKSLRQDLTVQHIKNDFTVHVYETHARIALEKGDLGEYNQCQTQLRALYAQHLGGRPAEFQAYRLLYLIHTGNRTAMNDLLAELGPAERRDPAVRHALEVRSSLALGNYHRFFRLYLDTPNMGAYLMDMFVERERLAALASLCRA